MATIKEQILEKIRGNELRMKPRAYFTLRLIALGLVASLILVLTVFIFNFIFFSMRVSGHAHLFRYGFSGIVIFLALFPWTLLFADLLLVILLEHLLRRFRFASRQPILYVFLVLLALAISAGIFIDRTSDINERLLHHADRDELPGALNEFYEGARRLPPPEFRI
jgi:hypothetical protein